MVISRNQQKRLRLQYCPLSRLYHIPAQAKVCIASLLIAKFPFKNIKNFKRGVHSTAIEKSNRLIYLTIPTLDFMRQVQYPEHFCGKNLNIKIHLKIVPDWQRKMVQL